MVRSESINTKISHAKIFIGLTLILVVLAVVWSAGAKIDEIVHAPGRLVSISGVQTIQAADPGQVSKIFVHEGLAIKKGQRLLNMQSTRAQASYDDSASKVAALKTSLVRLQAEVLEHPLKFPEELNEHPDFVKNQTELFRARQRALRDGVAVLQKSLRIASDELSVVEPLFLTGDIGKAEILRLQRQSADIEGQIINLKNKYFQDAQAEMTRAEEELSTREQELADRAEVLHNTTISAPMNGIVRNINIITEGANVNRGDVIMELVPTDGLLIFEAKLRSADVAFVRMGAPATIKLDAYDYSVYGMLKGKIDFVSPDALSEKTARGEEIFYRVRVLVTPSDERAGIELQPGMTGQVDIKTGDRTVLSYLTKPITKTFSESLTEK